MLNWLWNSNPSSYIPVLMNEQKQDCYRAKKKKKNIWWKQSKCCFWPIAKQQEDDYLYIGNHILPN